MSYKVKLFPPKEHFSEYILSKKYYSNLWFKIGAVHSLRMLIKSHVIHTQLT